MTPDEIFAAAWARNVETADDCRECEGRGRFAAYGYSEGMRCDACDGSGARAA